MDIQDIAKNMKEKIGQASSNEVVESPSLSLDQAKELNDSYLSSYVIFGIDPADPKNPSNGKYVVCVKGGQNA